MNTSPLWLLIVCSIALSTACGGADATPTSASTAGAAGAGGTGGNGGTGGSGGSSPSVMCEGRSLLETPADPGERGPWVVGAKTVTISGLTTEIWYPAKTNGAPVGDKVVYDPRKWLPASEQSKIPDSDTPYQFCDCYRDLPIDDAHGPYPVVLFLHGTAAFRTQSLSQMVHWASRGFVVVSADHPKLYLADLLSFQFGADQPGDAKKIMAALGAPSGDLAFLDQRILLTHMGMVGHSAGGNAVSGFGNTAGVKVLIPMAAGGTKAGSSLESSLILGAQDDQVVAYTQQTQGYASSPVKKRLVGVSNAGHLAFSDLCAIKNDKGQDFVQIAQQYMIQNAQFASALWDGCAPGQLEPPVAAKIVNHVTTAVLEETLQCGNATAAFTDLSSKYPAVAEYQEAL